MISKYNGSCRYCKLPTKAGVDQYDLDSKSGFHTKCEQEAENQPPSREQFELAERLGYEEFPWDRILRFLSPSNHGRIGRDESETFGRDTLSRLPTSETVSINDSRGEEEY